MPSESPPLVSAIIIFLDERQFLAEAIESVFAQTYPHWELLLIDDGSSDGSTEVARRVAEKHAGRVRYLEHACHANRGMSASRNLGCAQARGTLIAFLDGDDVWLPHKLERQVEMLQLHSADMVYGTTEFWHGWTGRPQDIARDCIRGIGMQPNTLAAPPELMLRCFPLGQAPSPATCSLLVRRETVENVGGFETNFQGMFEDQAFLAKLYLHATIFVTDECHAKYRVHRDSCVSRSTRAGRNEDATRMFLKWLEAYLKRQGIRDPAISRSLRQASRFYRYPNLFALTDRLWNLSRQSGIAAWRRYNRLVRATRQRRTGTITAVPNPVFTSDRFSVGATTLSWRTNQASTIEVRVNAPDGPLSASSSAAEYSQIVPKVENGTCFYLQDVTDGRPLTFEHTLDVVRVRVVPVITPDALSPHEMPPEVVHDGPPAVRSKAADSAMINESTSAGSRRSAASEARAIILLYHRIANVHSDPWTLAVTPERFDEQLKVLRAWGNVVSLSNLWSCLIDGALSDRSVAITFDDGYADNLHEAKALLERHKVPATFFVTTGILNGTHEFWWDAIDRLFLQTTSLPRTLTLTTGGDVHQWDLGDGAEYPQDVQRQHRHWRAWGEPDPTIRHQIYRSIYSLIYPLSANERRLLVDDLLAWGGLTSNPADRQTLTPEEVVELGRGSLIEIGAHSVSHSLLGVATADRQQLEIQQSKEDLERILERPVTSFSYPFGKRGDYSEETVNLVRESGFNSACSNFFGFVSQGVDVFQLPRVFMGNWNADEFATQLRTWFGD